MRTRSRSRSRNNSPQREASPAIVEPLRIELPFLEDQFQEDTPPESSMADNRTMEELLQAPTEGYKDAIVILEITANNFELKHSLINMVQNKQFFRHDKEDPHAHIRYFNKITSMMRSLKIIESKSKVRQSRAKAVVAKVGTSSSTPVISSDVAELKDMAPIPQTQRVSQTDFESYVKASDAILRNMQSQGTLPGNTVTNPKEDLKGITTRSGVAYQGPKAPSPSKQGTKVTKDQV
nr:reverse transcriptase domain-containing protein [Tanacetum cinerariifolium]